MTIEERMMKLEADAAYANYLADKNAADLEYVAMMTDVEIDEEGEPNEQEV